MRENLAARVLARYQPFDPVPTGVEPVLTRMHGIRAVIFDVYGTIMLSSAGEVGAHEPGVRGAIFQRAIAAAGGQLHGSAEDVAAAWYQAVKASHATSIAKGVQHPEIDVREIWRALTGQGLVSGIDAIEVLALEYEMASNPVALAPGLGDLLDGLRSRSVRTGIVSNAQFYTPVILEALLGRTLAGAGIDPGLCVWSFREGEAKPSTGLYRRLIDHLAARGISAAESLFVGNDMLNDILPAAQCGMKTGLFAGDQRSLRWREGHPACRDVHPDAVFTSLSQIMYSAGFDK